MLPDDSAKAIPEIQKCDVIKGQVSAGSLIVGQSQRQLVQCAARLLAEDTRQRALVAQEYTIPH